MDRFDGLATWRDVFLQATDELLRNAADVLPRLFGVIFVLGISWLLAAAAEFILARGLRSIGFDQASSRVRMTDILDRAGLVTKPSDVLGKITFWAVLLSVSASMAGSLGFSVLTTTTDRFVAFLPDLIGAGLTLLLGLVLARFVGAAFGSAAAAAGFLSAARLGLLAQVLVTALVAVVALEQLGVSANLLAGPITALLATIGFAAGLAFALGAHPIVTHILAGHFLKRSLPRDSFVEVGGERGVVDRVGATDTLLRSGDRSWSIPNRKLLDEVVVR